MKLSDLKGQDLAGWQLLYVRELILAEPDRAFRYFLSEDFELALRLDDLMVSLYKEKSLRNLSRQYLALVNKSNKQIFLPDDPACEFQLTLTTADDLRKRIEGIEEKLK